MSFSNFGRVSIPLFIVYLSYVFFLPPSPNASNRDGEPFAGEAAGEDNEPSTGGESSDPGHVPPSDGEPSNHPSNDGGEPSTGGESSDPDYEPSTGGESSDPDNEPSNGGESSSREALVEQSIGNSDNEQADSMEVDQPAPEHSGGEVEQPQDSASLPSGQGLIGEDGAITAPEMSDGEVEKPDLDLHLAQAQPEPSDLTGGSGGSSVASS